MARKRRPLNEVVQIGVRLEEHLRRRLERIASQRGHSMNAEIVERLQRSFVGDEDKITLIARAVIDAYPDVADRIEEIFGEDKAAELQALESGADLLDDYYKIDRGKK